MRVIEMFFLLSLDIAKEVYPLLLFGFIILRLIKLLLNRKYLIKLVQKFPNSKIIKYMFLPFFSSILLENPESISLGKNLDEKFKASFLTSQTQFCHTNNAIFSYINPSEAFVWCGIAYGASKVGINILSLALSYMVVGLIVNYMTGLITDQTFKYYFDKKINNKRGF